MRRPSDRKKGRTLVGLAGLLLLAGWIAGALVAVPGQVARASHETFPVGTLSADTKVTICHTEGNASQHQITVSASALIQAGHFNAAGNPLHAVDGVHDFIVSIEGIGVINPVVGTTCVLAVTPTSTPTNTPTNTPTTTAVPPTNTAVPPTNTPTATATAPGVVAVHTATSTAVPPTPIKPVVQVQPTKPPVKQQVKATQPPKQPAPPKQQATGAQQRGSIRPPSTGDGGLIAE